MGYKKFLIVSALKLEFDAFVDLLTDSENVIVSGQVGVRTQVDESEVFVLCLYGMGNTNSAAITAKIVHELKPDAVFLIGIAGGIENAISSITTTKVRLLGDVIVPEEVCYYESGKVKSEGLVRNYKVLTCPLETSPPAMG